MRKRFLVVVGLPKSGTTFLYAECAKRPDAFQMPTGAKEVDYLRRGADLTAYKALFGGESDRVYVDASPLYIDDLEHTIANMKTALQGQDVKIVVCVRDPLERAFSHYLHDIAQHHKIIAHADYSFWSPTVMAKYLYPVAPKVRRLQEVFGQENVHGFAFGADMSRFEAFLRDFAGLDADWRLDLSDNPAPGFTSPQSYYNSKHDMEIMLQRKLYKLPVGHFLVANRQYSIYSKTIGRQVAEQIIMKQATLTRQFDTGSFDERTRGLIYDDMQTVSDLLALNMELDRTPRIFHSKGSESVPDRILDQLECVGSLNEAVQNIFTAETRSSAETILRMPHIGPSLALEMARVQMAAIKKLPDGEPIHEILKRIVETFGPIPLYLESVMHWYARRKKYDEALALVEDFGGGRRLLWPVDMARFVQAHNIELPEDVSQRFQKAGVRVRM